MEEVKKIDEIKIMEFKLKLVWFVFWKKLKKL